MFMGFKLKAAAAHAADFFFSVGHFILKLEWLRNSIFMGLKILGFPSIQFISQRKLKKMNIFISLVTASF